MFECFTLVADNDIGIIAPYYAQCLKLRSTLRSIADGIKVGYVEEFQGQVCFLMFPHVLNLTTVAILGEESHYNCSE